MNSAYKDISIPMILIPGIDFLLCKIFGNHSRWFQLHSAINAVIVLIIWNDVVAFFTNPLQNIHMLETRIDTNFVLFLHIYHFCIADDITFMDYFHHILFIGFGVIPTFFIGNCNIIRLAWLSSCGFPGIIEYLTLSLVKHKKLCHIKQKRITSYIYNYIRYPLTIYCPTLSYIAYCSNYLIKDNPYLIIYINLILFFNGAFYNKLTIENYIVHKNRIVVQSEY